jgi:hypothetical protein
MYDNSGYGPTFGSGHDLKIVSNANSNTGSYCNLGNTYTVPPGGDMHAFFTGARYFQVAEYEVFAIDASA